MEFLGKTIAAPVFISCMTGGSDEGFRANENLAKAAQTVGVPVGMGSIRVLFEHDEVFEHFHLKKLAPDVPVLANIGGVQIRELPHNRIRELCTRLEVDALVIHLNPGQELFQPDGDRDFRGIREAIGAYCSESTLPVIVKETGFGIAPHHVAELFDLGVSYVDLAGAGGTNWISVEAYRGDESALADAHEFGQWGLPTAILLSSIRERFDSTYDGKILASGGLRAPMDMAKSIALGAGLAGTALPLIREEAAGGVDAVVAMLERIIRTIHTTMVLTGSQSVDDLRRTPLWFTGSFRDSVQALSAASILATTTPATPD